MASIDKQASRIARASFAVAPIIPPLPRGFIRNQNQALSRLQITKSTPKWRLRLDETTLTARTSSIHLLTPSSRFRETRRVLDTYRSEFAAAQRWVTYGILKRRPSPHFREMHDSAVVFLYDGQTSRAPFGACGPSDQARIAAVSISTAVRASSSSVARARDPTRAARRGDAVARRGCANLRMERYGGHWRLD
jgi:hypothetical protein